MAWYYIEIGTYFQRKKSHFPSAVLPIVYGEWIYHHLVNGDTIFADRKEIVH